MRLVAIVLICILNSVFVHAQDTSVFKYPIEMDVAVVSAKKGGWDVKGFMERVQNDTTFYKAFRSMHLVEYTSTNNLSVLGKKGKPKATYYSIAEQKVFGNCRTMNITDEKVTGKYYDSNDEHKYYTAELFDYLFITRDTVCDENDIVAGAMEPKDNSLIEKNKYKLKQLIFNPGSKIDGVPLMGDKAAIFKEDVAKLYNFKLSSEKYKGIDCYVFSAIPKREHIDDVVYKKLVTWFRKTDYSIVARDYSLQYSTLLYDFDVDMKVRTRLIWGKLLPVSIQYDGNWHVFTQKRERVKFTTTIVY